MIEQLLKEVRKEDWQLVRIINHRKLKFFNYLRTTENQEVIIQLTIMVGLLNTMKIPLKKNTLNTFPSSELERNNKVKQSS